MYILNGLKNTLLDILFPMSVRARRVMEEKDAPLPLELGERVCGSRSITTLSSYDEPRVRDAICALKFERDRLSLRLLSALLDEYLVEQCADELLFGEQVACVPVPLGKGRLKERGMNQVEEILKVSRAAHTKQVPFIPALVRTRDTLPQSTLPRAERLSNVHGAFEVVPAFARALKGASVFLIDDVTTTGATLHEAAAALERAGAKVHAIALAG